MINQLLSRGILYSFGTVINRIVPAGLFRFRIFRVYQLQPLKENHQSADESPLHFTRCESDEDYRLAEELTCFQSTSDIGQLGYEACLAFDATEPAGGLWRAGKHFDEEEIGLRVVLNDGQAWIFAAMVSRQHRRRGLYRRLLGHVLSDDRHRNHFAAINPTNRASIAAHRRFVRSTVGTCVSFRLFKIAFSFASGGLKLDRHISLECRRQPIQMRLVAIDPS